MRAAEYQYYCFLHFCYIVLYQNLLLLIVEQFFEPRLQYS